MTEPVDRVELRGAELLDALERGSLRVAERGVDGRWFVHEWIRAAILELFREDPVVPMGLELETAAPERAAFRGQERAAFRGKERCAFRDKQRLTPRRFTADDGVRVVPGGSAVRRGAFVAPGVVCMPPMYVNVGAYVGAGTMIDSHALVGSCAQIGARVHLSAAAQIGGVLEPPGARPVIVEDDAFVGGGVGIYEGVLVRERAVIAAGVVLTAGTPVFDLVHERVLTGTPTAPLEVPAGAVVVSGSRPAKGTFARERGLHAACALIVKYRDERTDAATGLEDALR